MKRTIMILALSALAAASSARAAEAEPIAVKGLLGIGVGSMPGMIPSQSPLFSTILSEPKAVVFRWWINEKISWEGQLGLDYSSQPSATTQTASNRAFGIGTAVKWNFKRPTETTLAQLGVGLSYAALVQQDAAGIETATSTTSLFVGPGFEAFLPFWRSISVEGSVRLRISSTQTSSPQAGSAAQSASSIGFVGDGFTPLSLAMNYYF